MRNAFRFAVLCVFSFFGCDDNSTTTNTAKQSKSTSTVSTPSTINDNSGAASTSAPSALPVAKFSITPRKGTPSTNFEFDASNSEGQITSYRWDFGDGTTGRGRRTQHKFQDKGRFPVTLTVRNSEGSNALTRNVRVKERVGGGGGEGTKCQYTNPPREVWFFKVIANDPVAKTIIAEFQEPAGCDDVFYLCGDVRIGGIEPNEREFWIGTICEMWNLGNNRFRIHLVDGRYWVENGETGTYVWPQYDCDPSVACDDFGY
ncbi:MAG TPA: PKD domain-containing protein [Acidobacteriota bacterium]|nr:PKD domain-containing protein [Acidobacteriota bacterium]